jgi:hypothetical protein
VRYYSAILYILANFAFLIYSEQQEYVTRMFKLFKENDLSDLEISSNEVFCPLSAEAPEAQAVCTEIFSTVISALRKDVVLPNDSTESFLNQIIGEALKSTNQAQVVSLSRTVASIINKWKDGKIRNI